MTARGSRSGRSWGRARAGAVALALLALLPTGAFASWNSGATGTGTSKANSLSRVAQPTATAAGANLTLSWSIPTEGAPPTGYLVKRYDNAGAEATVGSGCAGIVAVTACTESAVPAGTWRYTVTPLNANWHGAESDPSAAIRIAAAALTLDSASAASLPTTVRGRITDFAPGQTVTFRLDGPSGAVLAGRITPRTVPATGTATVRVTLPAGTATGPHTIYAVGSQGDTASAPFSVQIPRTYTTTGWDLDDASAGGPAVDASDPIAFAADGRTVTTAVPPLNFNAGRFLQIDQNGPLPDNMTPSSASFDFRYGAAAGSTACFYFDLRRASTNAVLATHGGPANPVGCVSSTAQTSFSTPLPEVGSSAIANDLRVRVYLRSSPRSAPTIDLATISIADASGTATLYDDAFTDAVAAATDRTWPLVDAGGTSYQTAAPWSTSFAAGRFLSLAMPGYVPAGSTVIGASFEHRFRRVGGGVACWYLEVRRGATLIGTHGSATAPISCTAGNSYRTDAVSLPEIDTVARANRAVLRIYVRSSAGGRTEHDEAQLTVDYAN